ncbi:MAG: SprT-like domain-containing protein [Bacteroidota bacterium]|nr:SprT-like domain-containing protein [Bacteroidota bacterium]
MKELENYIPDGTLTQINNWIEELGVVIKISKERRTKLGDFRLLKGGGHQISVNYNLNKYAFLITITHELAHAFVWKKYKEKAMPHGEKWKNTFKGMMLNFLNPAVFPDDILKALSKHLINPKASSLSDMNLTQAVRNYDKDKKNTISDIMDGATFIAQNGKIFIKLGKMRKRYKCQEIGTEKIYLFNPLAEIELSS